MEKNQTTKHLLLTLIFGGPSIQFKVIFQKKTTKNQLKNC